VVRTPFEDPVPWLRIIRRLERTSPRNRAILAAFLAGAPIREIAETFNVSRTRVYQIVYVLRGRNLRFRRVE